MNRLRVVYAVEEIGKEGNLLYLAFAANRKTAGLFPCRIQESLLGA